MSIPSHGEALAYLITWTTYGTWLPGDDRGWVDKGVFRIEEPQPILREDSSARLKEKPLLLSRSQRALIERTIGDHCDHRKWMLHAVNARSNHAHVVVTAAAVPPKKVREEFKAWCTRRLKSEFDAKRTNWWTEGGSGRFINDEDHLEAAIRYVRDGQ
ncbi:transposase [Stratiformator vulcanicus]|uniref:Transposase IS200-like domain-containing protein n=1 Tax=Stratiformator vulcanicus TaxID=2527980 RepID=A0A517R4I7_9PLAN|nr:transposase [Stratiformator vulcanicus]QDT38781.1 hypothetical protein Pan189_31790 [Stratiformator vulcanicus]